MQPYNMQGLRSTL